MLKLEAQFNLPNVLGHNITFANPYSWQLLLDADMDVISQFQIFADGVLLVKTNNLFSKNKINRYSFDDTSVAPIVFKYIQQYNKTLFLVGGTNTISSDAAKFIAVKYPAIKITGTSSGYFDHSNSREMALSAAANADFVVVGMGTPYQEYFLSDLRKIGWKGTGFTCGGYMDQLVESKGGNYYPEFVDKWNLRAFYRLFREPGRLWKRYLIMYPQFLISYLNNRRSKL